MIQEITKQELKEKDLCIFPEIDYQTDEQPAIRYINILTHVKIGNYICPLRKQYSYMLRLNYFELMKFTDSLMIDVNKLKNNFNPVKFENNDIIGIYKIIE